MSEKPRVAVVTGAGSGIGRAVALALFKDGYAVVLAGRRHDALAETLASAGPAGKRGLAVPTDVADPKSVDALFAKTRETFGRLDCCSTMPAPAPGHLVRRPHLGTVEVGDRRQPQRRVSVRPGGVCHDARPAADGGRIINNGSISAHAPRPGSAPYTASKHAITGLTKTISLDGRPFDIACGQIDIGNAVTPMTARMAEGVPQANGTIAPEPRMPVEQVGQAVVQMAALPLETNVQFMTIMATKMPFVGRG